jgi:hypothetical protein
MEAVGYTALLAGDFGSPVTSLDDPILRFRLRLNVGTVYSTDPMVWPSVFDWGIGGGMSASERRKYRLAGLKPPKWTAPMANTWEELSAMLAYLENNRTSLTLPYVTVAVLRDGAGDCQPPPSGTAWSLLGYDVSDYWLLSAPSNCGYADNERDAARARFGRHLNCHHLFTDLRRAHEFRGFSDRRLGTDGPTYVYALYSGASNDSRMCS